MGLRAIARKNLRGTSARIDGHSARYGGAPVPTVDRASSVSLPGPLTAIPEFGHSVSATSSSTSKPLVRDHRLRWPTWHETKTQLAVKKLRPAASGLSLRFV